MNEKLSLQNIADALAQKSGVQKKVADAFAKAFFDVLTEAFAAGEDTVKLKGLGTFKVVEVEARESVNVNTGERFTIEGHQKIAFIPDADLKERINKPFAAFETVPITEEQAAVIDQMEESEKTEEIKLKTTDNMEKKETESKKELNEKKADSKVEKEEKTGCTGLKITIWILSIIAVLALIIFLLWPLIGGKILGRVDKKVEEKAAVTAPAPAPKPAPTASTATAKPAEAKFALTKEDEAKALPLFTIADTVNYKITGTMTTHTMVKGDMLTTIALKYYGTKKLWPYIAKYNNIKSRSFKRLPVGYKVKVPKLANK
jgi:nucleoid DNA-binding protein